MVGDPGIGSLVLTSAQNATQMKKTITSRKSRTDWKRVDALKDEEIDLSDIPQMSPKKFVRGMVRQGLKPPPRKAELTLRVYSSGTAGRDKATKRK